MQGLELPSREAGRITLLCFDLWIMEMRRCNETDSVQALRCVQDLLAEPNTAAVAIIAAGEMGASVTGAS